MSIVVTQHTRKMLAQSFEEVAEHQNAIAAEIARHLASDRVGSSRDQLGRSTSLLVDLLISQAHWLVETGEYLGLDYEQSVLVEQNVGTGAFGPFGDKLAQLLPSIVPVCRAQAIASAWCDAFWGIILSMPRSSPRKSGVLKPALAMVGVGE